jgi:hypothetical protein
LREDVDFHFREFAGIVQRGKVRVSQIGVVCFRWKACVIAYAFVIVEKFSAPKEYESTFVELGATRVMARVSMYEVRTSVNQSATDHSRLRLNRIPPIAAGVQRDDFDWHVCAFDFTSDSIQVVFV